jgi:hypothetical protein
MKTVLIFTLLLFPFLSQSQDKTYESKEKRKEFYKQLISKHGDANIKYIFNSDSGFEFEQWLDGKKETDLISDYGTVIHELFHGVSESSDSYQYLLLDSAYVTKYNYGKVFNSKELNSIFRKGQQDSIMRYGLYVGGSNKLPDGKVDNRINSNRLNEASSIGFGIYGMFEEFCAYYQGANAAFKLFGYYEQKYGKKENDAWKDYMSDVKGDLVAFFEFRIFMSNYLSYAKNKHKAVYDGIVNNKEFKASFTLFEQRFEKLYNDYYKVENEILKFQKPDNTEMINQLDWSGSNQDLYKFISMAGREVADQLFEVNDGKYTFLHDAATLKELKKNYYDFEKQLKAMNKGNNGLMLFYANRNAYEAYCKKEYEAVKKELEVLRIKDLNESNYKDFLKKAR